MRKMRPDREIGMEQQAPEKRMGFAGAMGVMLFLIVAISVQVFVLDSPDTIQITLILVTAVAGVAAMLNGYHWKEVQKGILHGCSIAMLPMLILIWSVY